MLRADELACAGPETMKGLEVDSRKLTSAVSGLTWLEQHPSEPWAAEFR